MLNSILQGRPTLLATCQTNINLICAKDSGFEIVTWYVRKTNNYDTYPGHRWLKTNYKYEESETKIFNRENNYNIFLKNEHMFNLKKTKMYLMNTLTASGGNSRLWV